MRHEHTKQLVKNTIYRALGESADLLLADVDRDRSPTVLMYHKVNPVRDNPLTVPPSLFDEQMGYVRDRGYTVIDLDTVIAHYVRGEPLPRRSLLITFDDGYADNLEYAAPILNRYGYPGVLFVPVGYVGGAAPLPHEKRLLERGIANPTLDWEGLVELDRRGIRIESHGISHIPLAELDIADATREIIVSKFRLEERLGRPVEAFAFVKGSEAHFRTVHPSLLRQVGYELGFTAITGSNGAASDRFRLRRYNVEPFSMRTFELVLEGRCDLIAVKDTVPGTHARRAFNAVLGTR